MAFTRLGSVIGQPSTAGEDTTGATLIVVAVGSVFVDPTDNKGNTYTMFSEREQLRLFYCVSPTVGTGHTWEAAGQSYYTVAAAWYTGQDVSPADQANDNSGFFVSSVSTGSVTPTTDNQLLVAAALGFDNLSGFSVDGGFTLLESMETNYSMGFADLIQTTATAANPTFSWSGSAPCEAVIGTFKAAASAAGNPYYAYAQQ